MAHAGLLRGLGHTSLAALYFLANIVVVWSIPTFLLAYELDPGLYGARITFTLDQATRAVHSTPGLW